MRHLSIILGALYLRGGPRPVDLRRSAWPEILKLLRRKCFEVGAAVDCLRDAGYWGESLVLERPGLLGWAESHYDSGRLLTAADGEYPSRWVRVMGASAPPALWKSGELPLLPSVSIVGSRHISSEVARFCFDTAKVAVASGFAVVSGAAEDCDRAAARGAGGAHLIELLPHGLHYARNRPGCVLSVCAPDESFSGPAAMERNALIYAASSHTLVGHARFKEGGTWHGAVHAARLRLTSLLVRPSDDQAARALVALGGAWLASPDDLPVALKSTNAQGQLFDHAV